MPFYNNVMGYPQYFPDQSGQFRAPYQTQALTVPQPVQSSNNGVIWVQGEEGAKAYMVAPGNTVQLWDSENPVIYLKSADMSGVPSMRIFDLVERTAAPRMPLDAPKNAHEEYVTRAEFDALADKLNALMNREQTKPAKSAGKAKEETDNG